MGYAIGTVTKAGGGNVDAHYQTLEAIKTLAEANGWTTLRYDTTKLDREWIARGVGLSGTEQIFIGIRTYQDVSGDYYNLLLGTFIGYVAGNSFDTQPGAKLCGVPCHNNAVTYFITCNAQRIAACFRVGTPVYTHAYVGKMFPYARAAEYPSPLVCGGSFNGAEARRFSDTSQVWPYSGRGVHAACNLYLRDMSGSWNTLHHYPFSNGDAETNALFSSATCMVPVEDAYQLEPVILQQISTVTSPSNVWGELDGVSAISGFNNGVENVVQVGGSPVNQTGMSVLEAVTAIKTSGGRAYVILQNLNRTGWSDFIAMEM